MQPRLMEFASSPVNRPLSGYWSGGRIDLARTPRHQPGLPTREQILEFIEQSREPAGKRENHRQREVGHGLLVRSRSRRHDDPAGLRGDQIPLEARIIAVADVVDAMVSDRPYRPALGMGSALDELVRGSGTIFEPIVVGAWTTA